VAFDRDFCGVEVGSGIDIWTGWKEESRDTKVRTGR
jgi:hypothetical protein